MKTVRPDQIESDAEIIHRSTDRQHNIIGKIHQDYIYIYNHHKLQCNSLPSKYPKKNLIELYAETEKIHNYSETFEHTSVRN